MPMNQRVIEGLLLWPVNHVRALPCPFCCACACQSIRIPPGDILILFLCSLAALCCTRYFSKGAARPSSTASYDKDKQDKLWELSLQATGIAPEQYISGAQQK